MAVKVAYATSESFCQTVLLTVLNLFMRSIFMYITTTFRWLVLAVAMTPPSHSYEKTHLESIKKVVATAFNSAVHCIAHCTSKRLAVAKSTSSIIRVTSVDCMTQLVSKSARTEGAGA